MKQSGNTIQNANLQEFLDSAANAADYGQRQFLTPPAIAAALFRPLPALVSSLVTDLHFGSGSLARAAGATTALGLDNDARVSSNLEPPENSKWEVTRADLTRWYALAHEAGLRFPYITINPPFSLRWYADRLTALADSTLPEVARAYQEHRKDTIDSTLASFLIALDRLLPNGEGFMICNAATARRLFGSPEATDQGARDSSRPSFIHSSSSAKHHDLKKYIYLWLEIPGKIFDNQQADFDTAVLYFSRSHGPASDGGPLFLTAPSADPLAIERTLMTPEVFHAHRGTRFRYEYEFAANNVIERFRTVAREYAVRFHGGKPTWNISLDDRGRILTHLTPFQHVSTRIPPGLAAKLHALNGQTPVAMCVTATTRTALRDAMDCGFWRIHPDVPAAIAAAMRDFDAQGAPFFSPSSIQSLGWVDEYSTLACREPGIGTAMPGDICPIACSVEPTCWSGSKINLAGDRESLQFHGKELLVKLTDPSGCFHYFHVRRDESTSAPETGRDGRVSAMHWHIADLITHFHVPTPQDITALRPQEYQQHLQTMDQLEQRVRKNLAGLSN